MKQQDGVLRSNVCFAYGRSERLPSSANNNEVNIANVVRAMCLANAAIAALRSCFLFFFEMTAGWLCCVFAFHVAYLKGLEPLGNRLPSHRDDGERLLLILPLVMT